VPARPQTRASRQRLALGGRFGRRGSAGVRTAQEEGGRECGHGQVQADQDRGDYRDAGVGLVELVDELAPVARGEDEPEPDDKEQDQPWPTPEPDCEREQGSASIGVAADDPIITGKIALAYLKEFADHYEPLERMEREAERDPSGELESEPGGSAL